MRGAGDVATHIGERDTSLLAESRDQSVLFRYDHAHSGEANEEKEIDEFASLPIREFCTLWPHLLPCGDGFSHNPINWFGERGGGLVDRNIKQANGISGQASPVPAQSRLLLPTNAADPQTNDFVAAKAGEEPGDASALTISIG